MQASVESGPLPRASTILHLPLQAMAGENQGLACKGIHVKRLAEYLCHYDKAVLNRAVNLAQDATMFWKGYKQPGRKVDLCIKSYGLELRGAPVQRKPWLMLMMVLVANKQAGGQVILPEVVNMDM